MTGKDKCKVLKEIRKQQAEALGIDLHQRECTFEGECRGTCPKCKAEEMQLNAELLRRKALAVGGAVGVAVSLTACTGPTQIYQTEGTAPDPDAYEYEIDGGMSEPIYNEPDDDGGDVEYELEGDVPYYPENDPDYILEGEPEYDPEQDPDYNDPDGDYMLEGDIVIIEDGQNENGTDDGNCSVDNNCVDDGSDSAESQLGNKNKVKMNTKNIDIALDRMFMIESDR